MSDAIPVEQIYVEREVTDLPSEPENPSFAVTRQGIFEFDETETDWRPIEYGSAAIPVPGITARRAMIGTEPTNRPLISNGSRTLYVDPRNGDDSASGTEHKPLATIQAALQRVPIYLRDQYVIDVATVPDTPVTYDEDVLVPAVIGTGQAGQEAGAPSPGPFINLVLRGNRDDPGAVSVGSVTFGNVVGTSAGNLYGMTIYRDNPYDDEGFGVAAYGDGEVKLVNVSLAQGPTNGVLAYGARMKTRELDFGESNLEIGLKAKRHASVMVHNSRGTVNGDGFRATSNSRISIVKERSVSGNPLFNTLRGGLIYDGVSDSWIGMSGNDSADISAPQSNSPERSVETGTAASPGDIWYEDGSGSRDEGFYGLTEGEARRLD